MNNMECANFLQICTDATGVLAAINEISDAEKNLKIKIETNINSIMSEHCTRYDQVEPNRIVQHIDCVLSEPVEYMEENPLEINQPLSLNYICSGKTGLECMDLIKDKSVKWRDLPENIQLKIYRQLLNRFQPLGWEKVVDWIGSKV